MARENDEAHRVQSDHQRKIAAQTAAALFTKHPRWLDSTTGEWKAMYLHPYTPLCRSFLRHLWGWGWGDDLPPCWDGPGSLYNFIRFVETYLPPRPAHLHQLGVTEKDGRPLFHWRGKDPDRGDHSAEAERARMLHPPRPAEPRLNYCCMPTTPPEPHEWSQAEYDLPDDLPPESYVLWPTLPWWFSDVEVCLCTPESFWVECSCDLARSARA